MEKKTEYRKRYLRTLGSTAGIFLAVVLLSLLIATTCLHVIQVTDNSMAPTLQKGDIVIAVRWVYRPGDLVAIDCGGRLQIIRIAKVDGDVCIDDADECIAKSQIVGKIIPFPHRTASAYFSASAPMTNARISPVSPMCWRVRGFRSDI